MLPPRQLCCHLVKHAIRTCQHPATVTAHLSSRVDRSNFLKPTSFVLPLCTRHLNQVKGEGRVLQAVLMKNGQKTHIKASELEFP